MSLILLLAFSRWRQEVPPSLTWLPRALWAYIVGSETKTELLRRQLGAHFGAMEAINELSPDSKVLFLFEPRSYYCERDCLPDSSLDTLGHFVYLHGQAGGIAGAYILYEIVP